MQKKLCKNIYKLKSLFKVLFRLYLFQAYALNAKDEHFPNKKKISTTGEKRKKKEQKARKHVWQSPTEPEPRNNNVKLRFIPVNSVTLEKQNPETLHYLFLASLQLLQSTSFAFVPTEAIESTCFQ